MRGSGPPRRARHAAWIAAGVIAVSGWAASAVAQTATQQADEVWLEQNVPNPFTPGVSPTIFTFTLPEESRVRLAVYNLLAQEVVVLADDSFDRGTHRVAWDGIDARGQPVPAGVYWYKLEVGERRPLLRRLRVRDVPDGG